MPDTEHMLDALNARAQRRDERRAFFRTAVGAGVVAAGGMALNWSAVAQAQTAPSDTDILNFALNLEYLEAQFYITAATGTGLPANLQTGTQTQGAATGARKATLTDPIVIQYAQEIANDELAHVTFLRSQLGSVAVAQPAIDLSVATFTAIAVGAGLDLSASGGVFDPYANDNNFLLGAYLFEDVGVTAYKGGSPLISSNAILDAAAGILATEAFHAGIIRGALYRRGVATPQLITYAGQISDGRDTLDGTATSNGPPMRVADDDQGIAPQQLTLTTTAGTSTGTASNFVPTDANGLVFSRNTQQVHNIVYNTRAQATSGGFFPNGTNNPNAALRVSGAN